MSYGPLIKYGLILLVFVVFCLGLIAYGEHRKQIEWDAAIAKQAVKSADMVIKGAENTAVVVTKYIRVKGATEIRTETVEKEVIRYVEAEHPTCFIPNEFEWVWDHANGVPTAPDATERTDGGADSGLTTVALLSAHADEARQYAELRDKYLALVEWVKTSYAIQKEGAWR